MKSTNLALCLALGTTAVASPLFAQDITLRVSHNANAEEPYGVGMRVSHGCMRLYPEDIEHLYREVPVGTPVRIVNQPYLSGWHDGTLYLEAHPPLSEDRRDWIRSLRRALPERAREYGLAPEAIDWERVEQVAAAGHGVPVPILRGDPLPPALTRSGASAADGGLARARRHARELFGAMLAPFRDGTGAGVTSD